MLTEIIKLVPKIDNKDLAKMTNTLGTRLTKIAKNFGKGLTNAFKTTGVVGIGLALIDKVLNPLKEVQEAIERTLGRADDINVQAKEFGTTSGNLAKLQAFGQASGLQPEDLNMLIGKFQGAVAEAAGDPKAQSSVRNFVGDKDTAESFFTFIQSLKELSKIDKDRAIRVQQEVFGEKQRLKMSEFLNQDFEKLAKDFSKIDSTLLSTRIDKLSDIAGLNDSLAAQRGLSDLIEKGGRINSGMILANDASARKELARENERVEGFKNLKTITETMNNVMMLLERGVNELGKFIAYVTPYANRLVSAIEGLAKSRIFKGFFGGKGE